MCTKSAWESTFRRTFAYARLRRLGTQEMKCFSHRPRILLRRRRKRRRRRSLDMKRRGGRHMPWLIFPKGRRHNISLAHKRAGRTGARTAPSSMQKRENVGWKNAWDTRFPSGRGERVWSRWFLFFSGCCQNGSGV